MTRLERGYSRVKVNLTLSITEADILIWAFTNDNSEMAKYIKERVEKAKKEAN